MLQKSLGAKRANSFVKIDCLFILRTALAVRFSIPKCYDKYEKNSDDLEFITSYKLYAACS